MSNLAKVICLLLVATATSALDLRFLSSAQKSIERELYSSTQKVLAVYQNGKTIIDELMSQMELRTPSQPSCWKNYPQIKQEYRSEDECISVECVKLFNKLVETNNGKMIECLGDYMKAVQFQHNRLNQTLEISLQLLMEEKYLYKSCLFSHSDNFPGKVRAALCINKIKRKLPGIVKGARSNFSAEVRDLQEMGDLWISDAAYCVAVGVDDSTLIIEWHNACKASKPFDED